MEIKYMFDLVPEEKFFFSDHYLDPSKSAFIKERISVIYTGDTLNEITSQILRDNLSYENFKVRCINIDDSIDFKGRRKAEYAVGYDINGEANMHNPEILLGLAMIHGKWIFGELSINNQAWSLQNEKPFSYSNALGIREARAIVNIASAHNPNCKMIDPCCGIGTVLIEALSLGLNIKGYELNPYIAENAKKNLQYFGYEDIITHGDMHTITDKYDVAIVDMPYGVFSLTTLKEQLAIIETTRRIAEKAVFVTFEDMEKHFVSLGFYVTDRCYVCKGKFKRYISVCE